MRVRFTALEGELQIEFDAKGQADAFEKIALLQDAFLDTHCGCCKSANIRYDVRENQNIRYCKVYCLDCGAQLDLSRRKADNSLFARRKDDTTKKLLPNRGWYVYNGPTA